MIEAKFKAPFHLGTSDFLSFVDVVAPRVFLPFILGCHTEVGCKIVIFMRSRCDNVEVVLLGNVRASCIFVVCCTKIITHC